MFPLRRTKGPDHLQEIVDFVFALENPIEAVGIDDRKGRFIEAIDSDRSVPRNMILQQRKEVRLFCRQLRMFAGKSAEALLDRLWIQADDGADGILKGLGGRAESGRHGELGDQSSR